MSWAFQSDFGAMLIALTLVPALAGPAFAQAAAELETGGEIILTASFLSPWEGEVWQKNDKFRCQQIGSASDRKWNNEACNAAIECVKANTRMNLVYDGPANKWHLVAKIRHTHSGCGWTNPIPATPSEPPKKAPSEELLRQK